jgi:membrane-associated protease RseP (regulator of RpoE activity)
MQSEPDILDGVPSHLPPPEPPPPRRPQRLWLHVTLFVATFISAMWFQSIDWSERGGLLRQLATPVRDPSLLNNGFVFALTLLTILLAHEMGHYLTARRFGVDQSLPYFIPAPTLFGTLGAVILMRSQPANRSVLLRVAAAGPFAGLLVALPACIWGLAHSVPATGVASASDLVVGQSILWEALALRFAPHLGVAVSLHPVAFAGWAGLLVTGLNLIPAAQLDGGHIAYALFGRWQFVVSFAIAFTLFAMGLHYGPMGAGSLWMIWAVLLFLVGLRHPPVRNETQSLSGGERAAGWLALVLFVITFVPVPIEREPVDADEVPGLAQPGEEQSAPEDAASPREEAPPPRSGEAEEYRL